MGSWMEVKLLLQFCDGLDLMGGCYTEYIIRVSGMSRSGSIKHRV